MAVLFKKSYLQYIQNQFTILEEIECLANSIKFSSQIALCEICRALKYVFCLRKPSVWGTQVCILCKGAKCVGHPSVCFV